MSSNQDAQNRGLSFWAMVVAAISLVMAVFFLMIRLAFPETHDAYMYVKLNQNDLFFGVLFLISLVVCLSSSE